MGGNRVLKGVTGGKRISLHCRGPYIYCTKGYKDKRRRVPPPPPRQRKNRGSVYERLVRIVLCAATRRLERGKRRLQGVSKGALYFSRSSFYSF